MLHTSFFKVITMRVVVVACIKIILTYKNETVCLLIGFRNVFEVFESSLATFVLCFVPCKCDLKK